jgi:hypothetical protein
MLGAFLKRGLGLTTFTLDTNCLIAIDEDRPEAIPVRALADAAAVGSVGVAIVAISASEKQQGGGVIQNFGDFRIAYPALGSDIWKSFPRWLTRILRFWTGIFGPTRIARRSNGVFIRYYFRK